MQRGDVYALRLPKGVGHEQQGKRLGVIVQSDVFLPRSVVRVAPTSRSAKPASFRPEIDIDGSPTRVLVERIGAVDINRLGDLNGHLTPEEQWGVDVALLTVFGLDEQPRSTDPAQQRLFRQVAQNGIWAASSGAGESAFNALLEGLLAKAPRSQSLTPP